MYNFPLFMFYFKSQTFNVYIDIMSHKIHLLNEWVIVDESQTTNFSAMPWREQATFWWDGDVHFILDKQAELDFKVLTPWNNSPRVDMSLH